MIGKTKNYLGYFFNIANIFFLATMACFFLPSKYEVSMRTGLKSPLVFIIVLCVSEAAFLIQVFDEKKSRAAKDITAFVFVCAFVWELFVSRLNFLPYVFVPAPENVFYVFVKDWKQILDGFFNSMFLLSVGMTLSIVSAVILGTLVGWNQRATKAVYPIAKAISTVPPLIYTPYVVLIMPTFRLASIFVIFLTNFWGTFMGSINNTAFVEKKIVNAAKVLNLSTPSILFKVIIPFNLPRIINGLPIQLASALMTLTAAEMLGAESGMGFYVKISLAFANYTKAIAGIFFIGFVVTGLNALINIAKKRLIKWSY
ncbi:MAG: ABC transporter permease subunit [Treponema sp.]|nr:ABC transporter permease subunit [Treponema sp.]